MVKIETSVTSFGRRVRSDFQVRLSPSQLPSMSACLEAEPAIRVAIFSLDMACYQLNDSLALGFRHYKWTRA